MYNGGRGDPMKPAVEILEYGKQYGVTAACRKYDISRTLFYRWLKRYITRGYNGIQPLTRKTSDRMIDPNIELQVLKQIKLHPEFGPLSIAYIMQDNGLKISHGGVYNIMKRHQLNTRSQRLKLSKQDFAQQPSPKPGQLWLAWTIQLHSELYICHLLDVESGIACSRLYTSQSITNGLDLLLNVALPISETVEMPVKWIVYQSSMEYNSSNKRHPYQTFLKVHGIIPMEWDHRFIKYQTLADHFQTQCHQYLQAKGKRENISQLKVTLQDFLRDYNIKQPITLLGNGKHSPLSIMTGKPVHELTLPLWAHIYRNY
jgi:transposase